MLIAFSFGNFRSFRDIQTLDLRPAKIKAGSPDLDKNIVNVTEELDLLKTVLIFGANASGKSNVIKAIRDFKHFALHGFQKKYETWRASSFSLDDEFALKPCFFQIICLIDNIRYRYGFEVSMDQFHSEWLYIKDGQREKPLMIREENEILKIDQSNFKEMANIYKTNQGSEFDFINNDTLVIQQLSSFGFATISKSIIDSIRQIAIDENTRVERKNGEDNESSIRARLFLEEGEEQRNFVNQLMKLSDTSLSNLRNRNINGINNIKTTSKNLSSTLLFADKLRKDKDGSFSVVEMPVYNYESEGTMKIFNLAPLIYNSLKFGSPLFIDEFDSRLHSILASGILNIFNNDANNKGQLIAVSHDTNLISKEILRRDQILFVNKDEEGASTLYSLSDFKGVRNSDIFEKHYLTGKYGAVPIVRKLDILPHLLKNNA